MKPPTLTFTGQRVDAAIAARCNIIYAALYAAAENSAGCPTNQALALLIGAKAQSVASYYVKVLQLMNEIDVSRIGPGRMVRIVRTGRTTQATLFAQGGAANDARFRQAWPSAQLTFLEINMDTWSTAKLAAHFKRSKSSVESKIATIRQRRRALGLDTKPIPEPPADMRCRPKRLVRIVAAIASFKTCQFLTGDRFNWQACGAPTVPDKPYCAPHCAQCYVKTPPLKEGSFIDGNSQDRNRERHNLMDRLRVSALADRG